VLELTGGRPFFARKKIILDATAGGVTALTAAKRFTVF
jgi:hypothetical protein